MNRHLAGGVLITLSMVVFSLIGPFIRYINLPPLTIILHTSFFTALLLLCFFGGTGQLAALRLRTHLLWLVLSAVFVLFNVFLYYKAYGATTLANTVLTHYTAPVFAALLAPVVLKERLQLITVATLVISMTGLVLIASGSGLAFGSRHFEGILYGTLSGFFYGLSILVSKRLVQHYRPFVILFYQCIVTVIMIAPFVDIVPYTIGLDRAVLLLVYTLVVCMLGVFMYLSGLRLVEAQHAGILAYSEPLIVVLLGVIFFKEQLTVKLVVGGMLILLSGYLILRAEARKA